MKNKWYVVELESIRDEIEYQKTNRLLNRPVDLDKLFSICEKLTNDGPIFNLMQSLEWAEDHVRELQGLIEND